MRDAVERRRRMERKHCLAKDRGLWIDAPARHFDRHVPVVDQIECEGLRQFLQAVVTLEDPKVPGDVADILIDLAQRETKTFSVHFAKALAAELKNVARMHKNPLKSAGFKVLKAPDVPSVLVELGYLSNAKDEQQLLNAEWRGKAADSITRAVAIFAKAKGGAGG